MKKMFWFIKILQICFAYSTIDCKQFGNYFFRTNWVINIGIKIFSLAENVGVECEVSKECFTEHFFAYIRHLIVMMKFSSFFSHSQVYSIPKLDDLHTESDNFFETTSRINFTNCSFSPMHLQQENYNHSLLYFDHHVFSLKTDQREKLSLGRRCSVDSKIITDSKNKKEVNLPVMTSVSWWVFTMKFTSVSRNNWRVVK